MVVMLGDTEIPENGVPLLQVYESAGDAVNDAVCPLQIAVGPEIESVGANTETSNVPVELQLLDVPITVYCVVESGVSVVTGVVAPVFQLYEFAPEAVSVTCEPEQISEFEVLAITVGPGDVMTT